jgi:type VI secretion system secreted protein Hcp
MVTLPKGAQDAGDMFLMVKGAKHGVIKGEAQDDKHKDEIQVLRWSWGMTAHPPTATGGAFGRATIHDLKIVKRVDKASTPLMIALRFNEEIQKAVLTLRKAGGSQLEFLKITIEGGRVTSIKIDVGEPEGGAEIFEHVTFSFNKIEVEYVPQGKSGGAEGSLTFQDQWAPNA